MERSVSYQFAYQEGLEADILPLEEDKIQLLPDFDDIQLQLNCVVLEGLFEQHMSKVIMDIIEVGFAGNIYDFLLWCLIIGCRYWGNWSLLDVRHLFLPSIHSE